MSRETDSPVKDPKGGHHFPRSLIPPVCPVGVPVLHQGSSYSWGGSRDPEEGHRRSPTTSSRVLSRHSDAGVLGGLSRRRYVRGPVPVGTHSPRLLPPQVKGHPFSLNLGPPCHPWEVIPRPGTVMSLHRSWGLSPHRSVWGGSFQSPDSGTPSRVSPPRGRCPGPTKTPAGGRVVCVRPRVCVFGVVLRIRPCVCVSA